MVVPITSSSAMAFVRREQKMAAFVHDKVYELLRELEISRLNEWESRFVSSVLAGQGRYLTDGQYRAAVKIISQRNKRFHGANAKGVNSWLYRLAEKAVPQSDSDLK